MADNTKQTDLNIAAPNPRPNECHVLHKKCDSKIETVINMTREAFDKMMLSIISRPVESGGVLLGEVGSQDVSDFFFDAGGNVTGVSYSPDYLTLNKKMKEEWIPAGLDMKGIVHSHPGNLDILTHEDLVYIRRLLIANPDMPMFVAPIIIPPEFRMRAMVVSRDNPDSAVEARINFF
jgi:proteasome lid subunit RPN8/RPN11